MKKMFLISLALLLFGMYAIGYAYDRGHVFITGKVGDMWEETFNVPDRHGRYSEVTYSMMSVEGKKYKIDETCKVFVRFMNESSAFGIRSAELDDVASGQTVTVRALGSILYEITIEEWER
ncbi:MAG: hypothetical protein JSV21_11855 [Nitrospirota bacterium]|nr:MAG: hypothetical protein JSV21_11855 [Nitrospirota bacterium]